LKGEADAARLLIHCSLAHHETLMPLAAKLAPAHDVFFDLPGHGRSAPWAGTDYHSMQRQSRQHFCMVRRTLSAIRLALRGFAVGG
jgi:pimeloyl-ACP methyl ester carboxylesterase